MESLYHQTNRLVQETQHLFTKLEKKPSNLDLEHVEGEIENYIAMLNKNCERLDIMYMKAPAEQKQNFKMRVDQLKYDSRHLAAALRTYRSQRLRRRKEEEEREALLSQRFTTNDEVEVTIDQYNEQYSHGLRNAVHGVDDMLQQGAGILDNLRSQRYTLKGAHKRLLDIGNYLKLSNTVMRFIERRGRQDGYILVGGMLFTVLVMILVVMYFT